MSVSGLQDAKAKADLMFRRKRRVAFAIPTLVLAYLIYVFFAFDIGDLVARANWSNAATLASDSWSHKVHVTRNNRSGKIRYAYEGERKGTYPKGTRPAWVTGDEVISVDLGEGHIVRYLPQNRTEIDIPGFDRIEVQAQERNLITNLPDALPEDLASMMSISSRRIAITTGQGRVTLTGARTEVFRYFAGWELFWFTLDSPYHGKSFGEIALGAQIDPERSNLKGALADWWTNKMWRHGDVAWAIGETILMAFLGTMGAALVALPLAFVAAKRFTPILLFRAVIRRLFDFVRGVDALIWTVVLVRAFGPGPLTGTLAILITDTGTFGKTFSEALENVDQSQIDGVASTGAKPLQRYRFGVLPQVMPVLLSQVFYVLESNTRSATIIGAITGGGIGLLLTQAIQTQKDWEEVAYYIALIVVMVMLMDWVSGWLRGRLIGRMR
ncbi:MAG: phosphonate ABC transporter, permease protein PhnE [Pseudomonadota bacterium]